MLYQTFKVDLTFILLKLFQKSEEEGMLLNSFHKVSFTLLPKPDKNTKKKKKEKKKKKIYRAISLMNIDAKVLNKILSDKTQQYIKKVI